MAALFSFLLFIIVRVSTVQMGFPKFNLLCTDIYEIICVFAQYSSIRFLPPEEKKLEDFAPVTKRLNLNLN